MWASGIVSPVSVPAGPPNIETDGLHDRGKSHRFHAPAPEVLPLALELAAQAAAAPGRRQAGVRNLLARAAHGELLAQSRRERREVIRAADLPEFRRRVKRFLGRKRPRR
jgi:enoyl-CoA hydratase/carnithine racemase